MAFGSTKSRVIVPIVEMTPMIDIIFLLIIFFMVAAQFAQQARVDLNLPLENGEQDESLQESSKTRAAFEQHYYFISFCLCIENKRE